MGVLLCDESDAGNIAYYLGLKRGDSMAQLANGGPAQGDAATLVRHASIAEVVTQDDDIEAIMSRITFQMDGAELADTTWRQSTANIQDYFNFGLDERTLKDLVRKQIKLRLDARQRRKIGSAPGRASLG